MGANRSKLLEGVRTNIRHKLTELSIDDLLDQKVLQAEYSNGNFREFLREDLVEEEEEEASSLLRYLELFKRDMMLNFTDSSIGKEIPNMSTNYIYDRLTTEYNNSYHNEFTSRVAQTTNFLMTIFLNLAKTETQKEEVVSLLQNLQKELSNDSEAQQKFFTVFSTLNNLNKMINIEKNYEEFFNMLNAYTNFLGQFVKGSKFTIYLIRDQVNELSESITNNIINNKSLDTTLRKKGLIALLKLSVCFKIVDTYLIFIENLLSTDFSLEIREELTQMIEEVFNTPLNVSLKTSKEGDWTTFNVNYNQKLEFDNLSSYATDGTFIYVYNPSNGLYKVGTGFNNTIQAKVYKSDSNFLPSAVEGSLVYACGRLFFRNSIIAPLPFYIINVETLEIETPQNLNQYFFVDKERSPVNLTYQLQGHSLIDQSRSDTRSRMISEGRFIYILSKVGELRCDDKVYEGLYPNKTLITVDVFDPLDNFNLVISFPIRDENHILGATQTNFATDALTKEINTDGRVILFMTNNPVTFNMITRTITEVDLTEVEPDSNNPKLIFDLFNSNLWKFQNQDGSVHAGYLNISNLNSNPNRLTVNYEKMPSHSSHRLPDNLNSLFDSSAVENKEIKDKDAAVFNFFFKEKKKGNLNKQNNNQVERTNKDENNQITSLVLNTLADGAEFSLNYSNFNSKNILSHVFAPNVLNLNTGTIKLLMKLQKTFMDSFVMNSNHELETKHFILSAIFKLLSANLRQIQFLKFDKFENFNEDFGYLREVVENSIFFISEFNHKGAHLNGMSVDLLAKAFEIVEEYSTLFQIEYPEFSSFMDLITKNNPNLVNFKRMALNCISKTGRNIYCADNVEQILKLLQTLMIRNDSNILQAIDGLLELGSDDNKVLLDKYNSLNLNVEYERQYENIYSPLLKLIFNSYMEISTGKDEVEKNERTEKFYLLLNTFERIFELLYYHMSSLIREVDSRLNSTNLKNTNVEVYNAIMNKLSHLLKSFSYSFRFFYSSSALINILIKESKVIFKTWHFYYDLMIQFDKSVQSNSRVYLELANKTTQDENGKDIIIEPFDYLLESSHSVKVIPQLEEKFEFKNPCNIYVYFDPLSNKSSNTKLDLSFQVLGEEVTEEFTNGFENKIFKNVKKIELKCVFASDLNDYGIKVHLQNYPRYTHYLNELQTLNSSIIISSLKTFFFFNYSKSNSKNKEVEEMLQSKLFEGGINELLDLEISSDQYKTFLTTLKRSASFNDFEKRLSQDFDDYPKNELPPFEIDEFILRENISVEKLITYFQKSLRPRFPWINVGGENADKIVRATFAVLVKQEHLYEMIIEVVNKIIDLEEAKSEENTLSIKELGEIENFEYLLLTWTEISRLRQWYQEQVKDLAEANSDDFDLQNENFVNCVVDKCRFLFTINSPKRKPKAKKGIKLDFLKIFAKSELLTNLKIDNDIVKANVIKFKKNLMQGKIDEGKSEIDTVKKFIHSITNCVKLTKVSIETLKTAMTEMNTRAKFREIALSLINSLLVEVDSPDTKLFVLKQIIQTLRKTSGKRLVSIDDEIKSASPDLLNKITNKFHNLIQILFVNLLQSKTIFLISEFLDCLLWNLRARNQKILIDVNFFENLFIHSHNDLIKNVWDKISKIKMNPYKKNQNSYKFDEKSLGFQLLEFFHIYASMIAGRVIDETHSEEPQEPQMSFMKKKSSVFDNSFDKLIENICLIILNKLREFMKNYSDLNNNMESYQQFLIVGEGEKKFSSTYFDEGFLNLFLLLVYKFNINKSNLIMKHMKDPEFIVSLVVLVKYASNKNKYSLVNILKVYLTLLSEEDLHNVVYFLRKNELFRLRANSYFGLENINNEDGIQNPRRVLTLYFLNVIFDLRKGIFTREISFSTEYEESNYIVNLLRSLHHDEKWRNDIEEVFIENLNNLNVNQLKADANAQLKLVSPILSVLNGDCEDLHYGQFIYSKFRANPKSITQMFRDKMEEVNQCTSGFILGFSDQNKNLNDMKNDKEVMEFLNNDIHFSRKPSDKYALIISLNKEMYEKNKLKNNDVEFQMKELHELILSPQVEVKINNPTLINLLLNKENELLNLTNAENSPKFIVSFLHVQLLKTINSLFKPDHELSSETNEFIKQNFSLERLRPLLEKLTGESYQSIKSNQYEMMNIIKMVLNSKTDLKIDFNDKLVADRNPVKVTYLRINRSIRIYKNQATNGNIFKIAYSNCAIDSDSFKKIYKLRVVTLGDERYKNYLNSVIYLRYSEENMERVNKIDDINFILLFSKKDLKEFELKSKITVQRFIVIDADHEQIEGLLNDLENDKLDDGRKVVKLIETIDYDKFKLKPEDVSAARLKESDNVAVDDSTIKYADPVEMNLKNLINDNLKRINELPSQVKPKSLDTCLKRLVKNYLRHFLVHILSTNPQLINKDTYDFISQQFKIVYYDACQYSLLTTFNYSRFDFVNNLLIQLVNRESEYGSKLVTVNSKTKMFNSFAEVIEEDFGKNVQSELIEFYFENELNTFTPSRENYIEFIPKILKLALVTLNYETFSFNQYLSKFRELFEKLLESITNESPIEELDEIILKFKKEGIDTLVKYLIESLNKESTFSSRTKIMLSFVWEFCKLVKDTYRRVYSEERIYSVEEIPKSNKLNDILNDLNVLFYKSKEKKLRIESMFSLEDVKKTLTKQLELTVTPHIYERKLNFDFTKTHVLTPTNTDSKGKMIVVTEKSEKGTYSISEVVGDDETTKIRLNNRDNLLIVNKDQITNEMWICGYNEGCKLGVEALSEYNYCYIPMQCNIDKNIRIKKVVYGYTCGFVVTYDNKLYVTGNGQNSGLDVLSKVFTTVNKWNDILKKEKFIDMSHNENSGFVFVTDKSVYVSGYNNYNCFGTIVSNYSYTSGIMKLPTPFKSSKVLQASLGYAHILLTIEDGSVYGMGCNACYELGLDNATTIDTLTKLNMNGLKCVQATAGYHTSLFLLKEKEKVRLYSCGSNDYGQNGQGLSSDKRLKKCVGTEDLEFRFAKIGYYCSCAITTDNKLYSWGYNGYHNLSHGDSNNKYEPTLVEFYADMKVLEVDINEKNMVAVAVDQSGQTKVYNAGYNGYATMGIGEGISSYVAIPLEVTTFSGSFVQKVSCSGYAYQTVFIKCNANALSNPFEFKCNVCEEMDNGNHHVLPKEKSNQRICHKCIIEPKVENELATLVKSSNVSLCIRNIAVGTLIEIMSLPDLTIVNQVTSEEKHSIQCQECRKLISEEMAYIVADELPKVFAFCDRCYPITSYFEIPKFVYAVKNAIDYDNLLLRLDSYDLLKFDRKSHLNLSDFEILNENGFKEFNIGNKELVERVNKSFDEIRIEHLIEYLKITDSEDKDKKQISEDIKKVPALEKLTQSQIEIVDLLCNKINSSMKIIRDLVDMNYNNMVKEIYTANLSFLSKKSRNDLFERSLYEGANDVSPDSQNIKISRGKAIKFKQRNNVDYQGAYTIFGQVFKHAKGFPISQFLGKKNNRLFRCELVGEGAIDVGGPYREIMNILCDELQSQWLDLLIASPNNKFSAGQDREKWIINPSSKSATHLEMYTMLGRLFGFAIRSTGFMNLNLPSFVWKLLLDQPLDLTDLERIDIHTANFLEDLMNLEAKGIDEEQFEYLYDQTFTTILSNGKEIELQNGGKDKKLTFSNAKEYVSLCLNIRFEESRVQIEAIKVGLFEVIKQELALVLNWKDLEERVCGNLIIDVPWLKENTHYESWSATDKEMVWFWKAMDQFNNEERILYLKFVWGRSRLPLTKDSFTQQHKIARSWSNHPDISLPLSHTCFFTIDIPPYSSYEILYNKILYAIRFCGEIDNDNTPSQALEDL